VNRRETHPRRRFLRAATAAGLSATLVAGCFDEGGGENGEPDEGEERILLETDGEVWIGSEPAEIEGEENPTLELVAGWRYEIGYVNRDGAEHSLALLANGEEQEATDVDDEEGEEQWLELEATDDLTSYQCSIHPETMTGAIEVDE
jgi:plastocyanin